MEKTKAETEHNDSVDANSETTVSQTVLSEEDSNDVTIDETLTTQTKSRFSFSFSRALQKLAASSFRRFQKNPYRQMTTQDSRRNSEQGTF